MKTIFIQLFICFCLVCPAIRGQEINFTATVLKNTASDAFQIIGKDHTGFYTAEIESQSHQLRLAKYLYEQKKMQWSKVIDYAFNSSEERFEQVQYIGNQFYVFTSYYHATHEQMQVNCLILDSEANRVGEPVLIHSILSEGYAHTPPLQIEWTSRHDKFIVFYDLQLNSQPTTPITFSCYDLELDILWQKELLLPYTPTMLRAHQFMIDNDTHLYMLSGSHPADKFMEASTDPKALYSLFYYNSAEHKLKEYNITLKDKQISSLHMCFDEQHNVVISGYFSNEQKSNIAGTFFYRFTSQGGGVLAAAMASYRSNTSSRYHPEDNEEFMPHYYLKSILPLADGNTLLIGEQQYKTTEGNPSITQYHYDHILITKLDSHGRHLWNTIIPKEQCTSGNQAQCSFAMLYQSNELQCIFNDAKERYVTTPFATNAIRWSGNMDSVTGCATIAMDGSYQMKSLFSNKEKGGTLNTLITDKGNATPWVMSLSGTDNYQLGIMR